MSSILFIACIFYNYHRPFDKHVLYAIVRNMICAVLLLDPVYLTVQAA